MASPNTSAPPDPSDSAGPATETPEQRPSRRRRWVYRLLAATAVPAVLLGLIEGGLRLGGYGYPTDFLVPVGEGGVARFHMERSAEAAELFAEAIEADPRDATARRHLGLALHRAGRFGRRLARLRAGEPYRRSLRRSYTPTAPTPSR